MLRYIFIYILFLWGAAVYAQDAVLTQNIRGQVLDAESKKPIEGVVILLLSDKQKNAMTDSNGYYILQGIPVGRQSFQFSMVGYEPRTASEVLVTSGKELELNISLTENFTRLKEVSVSANKDRNKAQNEFATVSARSFSVEETKRFAASVSDPARMAQNFMGVSNNDDMENGIVVRGNSPKGILWRLEGIEIPNPNHFGSLSTSGGAVSMLNASVLGTSDFYTGAFPAEIGNALSGAFDLQFRNGNTERREHTFQLGTLGVEAATEGPFKKGGKASYLVNYRYSTLTLLQGYFDLGGVLPAYQDASFKLNFPTKKAGTFSVFGLWGYNTATKDPDKDSTLWTDENPNFKLRADGMLAVGGITHQYFLNNHAYIKTIVSASYDDAKTDVDTLNPANNYTEIPTQKSLSSNTAMRATVMYNNKINSRNTFRAGVVAQLLSFDIDENLFDQGVKQWKTLIKSNGSTQYYQAYLQWKTRLNQHITTTGGVHASYYALNNKYSIEPRASVSYNAGKNTITLATGLHSKPEHISTYLYSNAAQGTAITYPNKSLDLLRAAHLVLGYDRPLPFKMRFKTEVYYQHLYNIPVEADSTSSFSIINAENIYSLLDTKPLVSTGTGRNYGIDMSIERPFSNGYYILATGSLFRSLYTTYAGQEYNTLFNRGYQVNVLGGKEWKLNAKGKTILGINGKFLYSGGLRESVIDVASSMTQKKTIYYAGQYYTKQSTPYQRVDGSVFIKFNRRRATHSIQFDAQNIFDRKNYFYSFFDKRNGIVKTVYQTGFIPNLAYRVEFH
ncbi:MAG: TonB-dependent receptor [Flavipsychrobacter sp.]|nr:TonB-dependent receptor [Flavipsychrobacter sp.]